ncbi:MAG: hypothetical protein V4436_01980 [Patescibacteria group bacterium]
MAVIYGASIAETPNNESNIQYDIIGKNSAAFTLGDPITVVSGQALVAGNSDTIVGIIVKTQTMASNNVGGANVAPGYSQVDDQTVYLMGTNTDLTNTATNFGNYCNLTSNTTGTVQVNASNVAQTTSNRVVIIEEVDPFNEGGTGSGSGLRTVLVRFVKTPWTNISITS